MEHLQHFGLGQDPFSNEPDLRVYFDSASHRAAQRRVERGLRQQKGLTLLTGEGGMGKTLLARRILDSLEEEIFEATLLVMHPGAADATGILQRFARQIGCEEPSADRATLLGQIYELLAIVREDGRHAVLMVDDAQIMTPGVFSELAGLLNLEYEDRRLLSMLLIGTSELDALVEGDPRILPRVDVRVRLQPLDLVGAEAYLAHRLASVHGNPELIPASAMETLWKLASGRPRLLNTLADNALFEAYLAGRDSIESGDLERAAADLGVGPDPGTSHVATLVPPPAARAEAPVASPDRGVPQPALVVDPPLCSLELDEPMAEFDLMPDMQASLAAAAMPAAKPTREQPESTGPGLELDVDLGAALEDFGARAQAANASTGDHPPALENTPFELDFAAFETDETDETEESQVFEEEGSLLDGLTFGDATADDALDGSRMLEAVELGDACDFELAEAELSPLGAGEASELDDAFVELLEE